VQFKERLTAALSPVTTSTLVMTRLWFLAVLTCVIVVACERVPLTSPTGSTISVTVDQSTMPLNGQATVRAVVIESGGTPVHNGTQVNFTSSLGTFNPAEATTVGGIASTVFLSGATSGTTRINAFSGGASTGSGNSSGGGVEVRIGAAAAGSLAVVATPPTISQSGGTVTISALVLDASNNPLPGVSVLFTSTAGVLSTTTALSDSTGTARTTLQTTTTATVRATASSTASGEVTVTVSSAPTITITAPDAGTVGLPVAISVAVTAGGTGGNNTPRQVDSLIIDYGDGVTETRTNVTGTVGLTHTYQEARGYTITATARDVNGNTGIASDSIIISAASLPTISAFTATPNPVPSNVNGLTNITVTAAAGSGTGAPPLRNVTVRNMTSGGEVIYSGTSGGTFAHRFGGTGTYTLQASATDASGNTGTTTTVVVVQ
jgi:hypothetical protein